MEQNLWLYPYPVYNNLLYLNIITDLRSREGVVSIATGYGLDDRGVGSSSHDRVKKFLHVGQTGSGVDPTSSPIGTRGYFLGGIIIIWFVRLLALRPLLAYCASLG
jgi:hypothetical protein